MHVLFIDANVPASPRNPSPRRDAFTLVELLVVLGIITVLIAMLMPALMKVRKQAYEVKCAANLRSIGHALMMYTQQYQYYPACAISAEGATGPRAYVAGWPVRLRPFLGGGQGVFYCPARDERCEWGAGSSGAGLRAEKHHARCGFELGEELLTVDRRFSYGYNAWGGSSGGVVRLGTHRGLGAKARSFPPDDLAGEVRASIVKVPSEMIAIADSDADGFFDYRIQAHIAEARELPGVIHRGGANVLFCDGHVQWFRRSDLTMGDHTTEEVLRVQRIWRNDHTDTRYGGS